LNFKPGDEDSILDDLLALIPRDRKLLPATALSTPPSEESWGSIAPDRNLF
jgi:hypothetical protein